MTPNNHSNNLNQLPEEELRQLMKAAGHEEAPSGFAGRVWRAIEQEEEAARRKQAQGPRTRALGVSPWVGRLAGGLALLLTLGLVLSVLLIPRQVETLVALPQVPATYSPLLWVSALGALVAVASLAFCYAYTVRNLPRKKG